MTIRPVVIYKNRKPEKPEEPVNPEPAEGVAMARLPSGLAPEPGLLPKRQTRGAARPRGPSRALTLLREVLAEAHQGALPASTVEAAASLAAESWGGNADGIVRELLDLAPHLEPGNPVETAALTIFAQADQES